MTWRRCRIPADGVLQFTPTEFSCWSRRLAASQIEHRQTLEATTRRLSRAEIMRLYPGGIYPADRLRVARWRCADGTPRTEL